MIHPLSLKYDIHDNSLNYKKVLFKLEKVKSSLSYTNWLEIILNYFLPKLILHYIHNTIENDYKDFKTKIVKIIIT